MKRTATTITLIGALTVVVAQAADSAKEQGKRKVTVCMENDGNSTLNVQARWIASKMFAGIGVTIDRRISFIRCPAQAIKISLSQPTPRTLFPDALAYAMPYEGTHIRVFYDRICNNTPKGLGPGLLTQVMVHEVTHILQGVKRHSDSGSL
jgi:hypothetical protein